MHDPQSVTSIKNNKASEGTTKNLTPGGLPLNQSQNSKDTSQPVPTAKNKQSAVASNKPLHSQVGIKTSADAVGKVVPEKSKASVIEDKAKQEPASITNNKIQQMVN